MYLARVEGNVVATKKHRSLEGWKLTICQPIATGGEPEGPPIIALDPHGADLHQFVIISSDGLATRRLVKDDRSPARWILVAIVDQNGITGDKNPPEESESAPAAVAGVGPRDKEKTSAAGRANGGGAPFARNRR
jgi:microcompartment protein CcmK/EutM